MIGVISNTDVFFVLLALPALIFVPFTFYFLVQQNFVQLNLSNFLLFHSVIFLSPNFFIQYKADPGAMLSGIFAILALMSVIEYLKNQSLSSRHLLIRIALFTWLSAESKPQFSSLIIFLILFHIVSEKDYRHFLILIVVVLIPVLTLLKDKLLGSAFLASADSNSPYAVVFQPMSVMRGILYYLEKTFTLGTILLFAFVVILQITKKQLKAIAILTGSVLSILFPLALIPNHLLPPYAWFGTFAIAIWLTVGLNTANEVFTNYRYGKFTVVIILAGVFFISKDVHSQRYLDFKDMSIKKDTYVDWILERQTENRNLENTARYVEEKGLTNVLFGGVYGPWHLFRNSDFVRAEFPGLNNYYIYLQNSEAVWNSVASQMDTGVLTDQINKLDLEWVVLVDQKGSLNQIIAWSIFTKLEKPFQIAALDSGILLQSNSAGREKYLASRNVIQALMKANSHDLIFEEIERMYG
jgi:hypothetical protein